MSTRTEPVWWHCWGCASNIRSYTHPYACPNCGSWDICEFRVTAPAMGQETMFERGAVDGDLVHPDDVEGRMRELIASLLRFRASVELREQDREVLARRTVPARSHWLPFPAMIFNGRAVGVVGVRSE